MPWMNSQSRSTSSTTPPYVNPVERVIQVTREEDKPAPQPAPSNVRMIPIAVEGRPTPPPAKKEELKKEEVKKEEVQLPWLTAPGKVVPIHLEGCSPAAPVQQRPAPVQEQQHHEQPPWRTQAAANANQIAAMMEE